MRTVGLLACGSLHHAHVCSHTDSVSAFPVPRWLARVSARLVRYSIQRADTGFPLTVAGAATDFHRVPRLVTQKGVSNHRRMVLSIALGQPSMEASMQPHHELTRSSIRTSSITSPFHGCNGRTVRELPVPHPHYLARRCTHLGQRCGGSMKSLRRAHQCGCRRGTSVLPCARADEREAVRHHRVICTSLSANLAMAQAHKMSGRRAQRPHASMSGISRL